MKKLIALTVLTLFALATMPVQAEHTLKAQIQQIDDNAIVCAIPRADGTTICAIIPVSKFMPCLQDPNNPSKIECPVGL